MLPRYSRVSPNYNITVLCCLGTLGFPRDHNITVLSQMLPRYSRVSPNYNITVLCQMLPRYSRVSPRSQYNCSLSDVASVLWGFPGITILLSYVRYCLGTLGFPCDYNITVLCQMLPQCTRVFPRSQYYCPLSDVPSVFEGFPTITLLLSCVRCCLASLGFPRNYNITVLGQ